MVLNKKCNDSEIISYFDIINILINSAYYSNIKNINDYISIYSMNELIKYGITSNNLSILVNLSIFLIQKKNFSLKIRILLFLFLFGKFK